MVHSTDSHPETIWFEMLLSDRDLPSQPAIALGEVHLANPFANSSTIEQTLSFTVPTLARLQRFNEIIIRYHLAGSHEGSSARVSVDRFIFVPTAR